MKGHNVTVNGDRYRAMINNFFIPELNNHDVQELWFQQRRRNMSHSSCHNRLIERHTTSGCFYPRSNHWEVGGRPQCDKCGCRVRIAHSIVSQLWRQFQTTGTAIRGSVVVVHEEPHPQMNGTLSYRPEETGGRQRRNC
ncbi:hypothetical protein TNCV_2866951 [Trichonephila clavipes]|nr:hypothetical protein TNCV_2866951 [Trichonephila clavipes]